jgi:hypothetical protein
MYDRVSFCEMLIHRATNTKQQTFWDLYFHAKQKTFRGKLRLDIISGYLLTIWRMKNDNN